MSRRPPSLEVKVRNKTRIYLTWIAFLGIVPAIARAQFQTLALDPAFSQLQVTTHRLSGPAGSGGITGLEVLKTDRVLNGQFLPAGTVLTMLGAVNGGAQERVYALDPRTGQFLPNLSVTYGPAAADGKPDAGMVFVPGTDDRLFFGMQTSPMAVFLGELQENGPGALHSVALLNRFEFSNGGGIGLFDEDTLYVTSWASRALYTFDFSISADLQLTLSNKTLITNALGFPGPDGVAIIPPNAAGELKNYAGNLVLARFGGNRDGFLDILDRQGDTLQRIATYQLNGSTLFSGPEAVVFAPDGTLYLSDYNRTLFALTQVPEPATLALLAVGFVFLNRGGRGGRRKETVSRKDAKSAK